MDGHVARMEELAHKILIGKSEWKRPLRRPSRRWEDNRTISGKYGCKVWIGCIWLRTGISY